ncbi:MAG: right-handed parallel beta-helix repeat-containing protein [Bacteroidota bacterium]|nr:right-handed parallel beta-helix repeat-containing protein [Bacteroidota bacterium]
MNRIFLFLMLLAFNLESKPIYVSAKLGNDQYSGENPKEALKSLQRAADLTEPGDTVYVMEGEYRSQDAQAVLKISVSGTEQKWIVYKNYQHHKPIIFSSQLAAILLIKVAYIAVDGFEITADPLSESKLKMTSKPADYTNKMSGILIERSFNADLSCHHIRIHNNEIHGCFGGGIFLHNTDYIHILYNKIYDNGHYSSSNNSGIRIIQAQEYDHLDIYHNQIIGNYIYNQRRFHIEEAADVECDRQVNGSGICLQNFTNHSKMVSGNEKRSKTLITNNIIYNNGGIGLFLNYINYVDAVNNTFYKNNLSKDIRCGEVFIRAASHCNVFNNIIYSNPSEPGSQYSSVAEVYFKNNMYYNYSRFDEGENDMIGDPGFVNVEINNSLPDFHLKEKSAAIDVGLNEIFTATDFDGNPRKKGDNIDLGAFEYMRYVNPKDPKRKMSIDEKTIKLFWTSFYNANAKHYTIYNHRGRGFSCRLYDAKGLEIKNFYRDISDDSLLEIDLNHLENGLYYLVCFTSKEVHYNRFIIREP